MRGELKALCSEKNATIVHATTECREAMALADRVAVLNQGRLMQLGTPDEVFHRPANEFVADFVGNPPMSLLDVEYIEEEGQPGFRIAGNDIHLPASPEVGLHVKEKGLPDTFRLSVRATELSMAPTESQTRNVAGEIFVTEVLGHRRLATVKVGNNLIRVVIPPEQKPKVGETVWLNLGEDNLHVFADGVAIAHPRPEVG
jgi:multiple sugar transport system ATP-binding protein